MEEDAESTVRSKTKSERCSFSFFSFIYEAQRRIQTFRFVLFVCFFRERNIRAKLEEGSFNF